MRDMLIGIVKNSLMKHIGKSCNLAENIVDDLLQEKVIASPIAFSNNHRERMIELFNGYYEESGLGCVHYFTDEESEMLADYILADGWIRPPCKYGDTIYQVIFYKDGTGFCVERKVVGFHIGDFPKLRGHKRQEYFIVFHEVTNDITHINFEEIGKTIFFTREEAEQALKERSNK